MRLVLVALVAAGLAAGHFTQDESQQSASLGGRFLFFATEPSPVVAGKVFLATLSVNDERDFRAATGLNVTFLVDGGTHAARPGFPGTYTVPLRLETQGTRNVTWEFPAVNGTTVRWDATLAVYRDLGVATAPADATADVFANRTTTIGVRVLNVTTGAPDPRVEDLTMRLERWSDDHRVLKGVEEFPATFRDGAWWTTARLGDKGMLHVKVASRSLGMGFEDAPYIHQYVLPEDLAPPAPRRSPDAALGALAALAAVALALRRR